jgi:hypothetical protein
VIRQLYIYVDKFAIPAREQGMAENERTKTKRLLLGHVIVKDEILGTCAFAKRASLRLAYEQRLDS